MQEIERLLEEAADELGRLDAASAVAPESVQIALRLLAVVRLAGLGSDPLQISFESVAAAEGDPLHDADLPAAVLHWRELLVTEERRVRGGATLTSQRVAIVAPTLSTYPDRSRLEALWRETGLARPVLARALDAAAWAPDDALGEATAALLLCAGGRADRARLLPFADVAGPERVAAIAAWRAGDEGSWTRLGLAAAARRARAVRVVIDAIVRGASVEEARLDALGRAAINARRALAQLRTAFVTTMPVLAESLELSRPAASDALERLVTAGLARELTGRARDRVFAYDAACSVASVFASS